MDGLATRTSLMIMLGGFAHAAPPLSADAPGSFTDALLGGELSADARIRFEHFRQDGFFDVDSLNARLRLGYTTKDYSGFQAMLEAEGMNEIFTQELAGLPEDYLINQAWLSYTYNSTKGTVGRQRLVLDNARFVGDESWRQNDQTFDGVVLRDTSLDHISATYAYLAYVSGVSSFVVPSWTSTNRESDSHVVNVSYSGFSFGTLTGYAYLLDFDSDQPFFPDYLARIQSCQTYGLSFAGSRPVEKDFAVTYRLEHAQQSDYGENFAAYHADYYLGELGIIFRNHSFTVGHEILGSGRVSFQTPLASYHEHNGWAEVFANALISPGLTDTYLKYGITVWDRVDMLAAYHYFGTETGPSHIGEEIDLMGTYRVTDALSFTVKYAKFFRGYDWTVADRTKVWLQADYTF